MNIDTNLPTPSVMLRTHRPEPGVVFFAMPFGTKPVNGVDCDFDQEVYEVLDVGLREHGLKPERLDGLYGPTAMVELIWRSIQRAEFVVVDFTTRNHNVAFELALALVLGKKIVMITQDLEHVPTDYRGHRVLTYGMRYTAMKQLKTQMVKQIDALRDEPGQERDLTPFWPGPGYHVPASATIVQVEREYAVVRTDDPARPPAVLSNADVDRTHLIADMTRRFHVGDRVDGAFVGDPRKATAKYTLLGGQEDPWPTIAQQFPPGKVFTGTVRKVIDAGALVAVYDDVNGLIPQKTLTGPVPQPGALVEVRVSKLDVPNRRVSLRLNQVQAPAQVPATGTSSMLGQRGYGRVVRAVPMQDGRGGFILLRIEGRERPAMVRHSDMSEDLRTDLANGQVDLDEEIYVEVIRVDEARDRVLLRELPDPEEPAEDKEDQQAA